MSDQAFALRRLIQQQQSDAPVAKPFSQARTIAVTSGKGGVGKSNIALNLAIAMAGNDTSVCLLDANLGLGNIDLLCGLNGYWNLLHVVTGARTLADIVLDGPAGIHVVPGASGLIDAVDVSASAQREILDQLEELERTHDYLLIDTGTGIHQSVRRFLNAADVVLVVTTRSRRQSPTRMQQSNRSLSPKGRNSKCSSINATALCKVARSSTDYGKPLRHSSKPIWIRPVSFPTTPTCPEQSFAAHHSLWKLQWLPPHRPSCSWPVA